MDDANPATGEALSRIYRANYNARQSGAADMRFTPGWAVRWYFIPIAWRNLTTSHSKDEGVEK